MDSPSLVPAYYREHRQRPGLFAAALSGWLIGFIVATILALAWPEMPRPF